MKRAKILDTFFNKISTTKTALTSSCIRRFFFFILVLYQQSKLPISGRNLRPSFNKFMHRNERVTFKSLVIGGNQCLSILQCIFLLSTIKNTFSLMPYVLPPLYFFAFLFNIRVFAVKATRTQALQY